MTFPIEWTGPVSGLVCGVLFGYVLQRGGLGNGCRLTAQLRLQDWTVFNVMFTAILVAAGGCTFSNWPDTCIRLTSSSPRPTSGQPCSEAH